MRQHTEDIPIMTAYNELIERVMKRHSITQDSLGYEAQLDQATISRIIHRKRPVTPEIVRALYKLTKDTELITYLFDADGFVMLDHTKCPLDINQISAMAVRASSKLTSELCGFTADASTIKFIDDSLSALIKLRTKLVSQVPSQTIHRQARPPQSSELASA